MIAEVRAAGLLLLGAAAVLLAAFQWPGDVFVDLGPNDGRYVSGFREDFEIDEPTLIHWTTTRSAIRLPFLVRGPYELDLRFKRHVEAPAEVRLFLSGEPAPAFAVPQQDFAVRTLVRRGDGVAPLSVEILTSSRDPRALGIALDWIAVRPLGGAGSLWPSATAFGWLLSWVVLFYALARLLDFGRRGAVLLGSATTASLAAMTMAHPLWAVHVALTLGLRAHAVALGFALLYRFRRRTPRSLFALPEARWAVLVVVAGLAVRLFGLFHPDFYYPDVRTHSKFVSILWTEGFSGFFGDYIASQHRHLLGLQLVSGRWVAFPYPPLLYLGIYPLSRLELPVEDWMKLVPAVLASVEALLVFTLARRMGVSSRASLLAVVLHASARVVGFRLAVASYAALFGHFWDVVAVLYLAWAFDRIDRPVYGAGLGALVAISLLSYAGSALVLGCFLPLSALALLARRAESRAPRRALAIAGWSLAGALVAVGSFYLQYVPELLGSGSAGAAAEGEAMRALVEPRLTPLPALAMAWHRLELFYWLPFVLAFAGSLLAVRRARGLHPLARPLALASLGTYLALNFLRAGLGATHIFQFSKDDLVLLPLFVIVVGMGLERLEQRGRSGRLASFGLVALWAGWGLSMFAGDVRGRFIRPGYGTDGPAAVAQVAKTTRLPPARLAR